MALVLDCFKDAHRLGVVQQTNHRNVAPDKVRHPAIIRVADILRLTERLPRPTTETGADCPIFGFNRIRVDRQAEIGCLTPFAGPSGKGEGTARHDETVCLTNGDHAAALDMKPTETVIVGDLEVVGIEGKTVKLHLTGACGSCPHATMTIKQGIERILRAEIDKAITVERVA